MCYTAMEPSRRIELLSLPYRGSALPLSYEGMSSIHTPDHMIENVDVWWAGRDSNPRCVVNCE